MRSTELSTGILKAAVGYTAGNRKIPQDTEQKCSNDISYKNTMLSRKLITVQCLVINTNPKKQSRKKTLITPVLT